MILGVGIDLVEVQRISEIHRRFGDRFLRRFLNDREIRYCLSHGDPGNSIAARFAAKEAVSKAFGTGIGGQLGWLDMEVTRSGSGQPLISLVGKGMDLLERSGGKRIHLSLTHTHTHAAAVAIVES